jgi:hypothetical protein
MECSLPLIPVTFLSPFCPPSMSHETYIPIYYLFFQVTLFKGFYNQRVFCVLPFLMNDQPVVTCNISF